MAMVEILSVAVSKPVAEQLQGRNIEVPKPSSRFDSETFHVVGWVLGRNSPVKMVEILHDDAVVQSTPLNVGRPDIVAAFPDAYGAEQSGFRTTVTVTDPGENELIVQAVLEDNTRVLLGLIQARRSRSGEEQESGVREESRPKGGFFRRLFGLGGG